jgi:signal transduction histidine kinase
MDANNAHRLSDDSRLRARLGRSLTFAADPSRLPATLTAALAIGLFVIGVIGLLDFVLHRDLPTAVQPVAALGLATWAALMSRSQRPRPALLLAVAISAAFGYLIVVAVDPTLGAITATTPIAIIVGSGVIALAAGGRDSLWVGLYSIVVAGAATILVQASLNAAALAVAVEAATIVVLMSVAFVMVGAIRKAVDDGYSRYVGLVESAPVAVVEVDLAGYLRGDDPIHIRLMNATASTTLGYVDGRRESLVKRRYLTDEFLDLLDRAAASPTGSIVTTAADGRTFKVGWQVDAATGTAALTGTDITVQRRAEEALADQITARDQFIATVSHELRTPLTGALGMLELVSSGEIDSGERDEMIQLALHQVQDMADIVEDLLVTARAASGYLNVHPETMNVSDSVEHVLAVTGEAFATDIEPDVIGWADPVRVRQIVKNLVTNAVRYGGTERGVVVATSNGMVSIEVRDSGEPLDPDFVARMFEPYERAADSRQKQSVGLGLTVARTLARLMGGDTTYEHDGEAVFRLTLPLAPVER